MEADTRMQSSSQHSAAARSDISFEDDADFLQALNAAQDQFSPCKKVKPAAIKRNGSDDLYIQETAEMKNEHEGDVEESIQEQAYMETDAYKPTAFGDFRSYMKNKRLKLKVQEESMSTDEARASSSSSSSYTHAPSKLPPLFKGTNIYINGHTIPPYGEMRRILHLYGGSLMPYLDQKTPVTHIIASNLTAKKRIEFKDYKVVRPEWVTQSIEQGKRLDWRDFRCAEDASGAMKMGALQSRAKVGPQTGPSKSREEEIEEARRIAAKGDWRSLAAKESSNLSAYNQSGSGAGSIGGVGPWGMGSRQKTLAGWAQKETQNETRANPSLDEDGQDGSTVFMTEKVDDQVADANLQIELSQPKRSQSEEAWLENLETPPRPASILRTTDTVKKQPEIYKEDTLQENKLFPGIGTDPVSTMAAIQAGHLRPSHPDATRPSNVAAAKLLSSPSWRERHTATSDDFLAGYFEKSRLHHLSTWKSEMKEMVSQALRESGKDHGSVELPKGVNRVIMHIDFDAFFVSVGLRNRPDLHQNAVVVCHGTSSEAGSNNGTLHSTSEIASSNYVAREYGIRNGMSLGQANRLCNQVYTIPYDFIGYNDVAIKFYTILLLHADALEAVSIDEALIDVSLLLEEMRTGKESNQPERRRLMDSYKDLLSSQGTLWTEEKRLAEALRDEIREATGCEASIGIGDNVLLARMATRKAKPGGSYHLRLDDFHNFAAELDVDDLHGVGWSIRNRCKDTFGTCKIGELTEKISKGKLVVEFGEKQGVTIWDKLHGKERDRLEPVKLRQSCGVSINYAIRFQTDQEAKTFVSRLSQEVSNRLKAIQLVGKVCSISIMVRSKDAPIEAPKFLGHGICDTYNRSAPFTKSTDDKDIIFAQAWKLLSALKIEADQLRGIGVSCQKLEPKDTRNQTAAGQAKLSFTTPIKKPAKETFFEKLIEKVQVPAEDDDAIDELLEPGPSGKEKRRRSITPENDSDQKRKTIALDRLPPSTQFVIPPASQLDPDVLSALPENIKAQILNGRTRSITRATSAEPTLQPSPTKSSPVRSTPEKHRTPVNPFLSMRATSTTPTKKSVKAQKTRSAAFELPSLSQMDPEVLAELPEDVRNEILREAGGSSSILGTKLRSAAPALASSEMMRRRASSDSPRKKQRFLEVGSSKLGEELSRTPSKLNRHYDATSIAIQVATLTKSPLRILDPKQVTRQELIRLEIDPDFFVALPEEVQKETLQEQYDLVNDKQARFKYGKQIQELSLQEERRLATQSAFAFDDQFCAKIGDKTEKEEATPNLKGKRTLDQIRHLLDTWFVQFQEKGPRQKDLDRFAKFLIECVEVGDLDQLDKVRGVLKWWTALLQRSASTAHPDWCIALEKVKVQVNHHVKNKFEAFLSLK